MGFMRFWCNGKYGGPITKLRNKELRRKEKMN
jgi:hypothetical protein